MILNEVFYSIQGEGSFVGTQSLFIRSNSCNLKCEWCDTNNNHTEQFSQEFIEKMILKNPCRHAVLTGGEPLMNPNLMFLIRFLKHHGFFIQCESNGTLPAPKEIDYLTVSPKRAATPSYWVDSDSWMLAKEFKYVVDDNFDFGILLRHNVSDGRNYYLTPEYNSREANLKKILGFLEGSPGWRLNLQIHKLIGVR
jgi:organic radical activating enzyme